MMVRATREAKKKIVDIGVDSLTFADGTRRWYKDQDLHREDGPAIEFGDGRLVWYLYGEKCTPAQILLLKTKIRKDKKGRQ